MKVLRFRKNILNAERIDMDARIRYSSCEPLWHNVLDCPHCAYSNHYLTFFNVTPGNFDRMMKVLQEQYEVVTRAKRTYTTPYDRLVLKYLQAIHLNEMVNSGDYAMIGKLWLDIYWLAKDVNDEDFAKYCAKNSVRCLIKAIDEDEISDMISRCSLSLSLANLLVYLGIPEHAEKYCVIAEECPDEKIKEQAQKFKMLLEKTE